MGDVTSGRLIVRLAVAVVVMLSGAPPAQAAITFVSDLGFAESNIGPNSISITTTAVAPAGASIIIVASNRSGESSGPSSAACSDTVNTYTTDAFNTSSDALTTICSTHQIAAALPAGSTLTIIWTGGFSPFAKRARAFAVTGLASIPFDRSANAFGNSTTPSSGVAAATTQGDELLVGAIHDKSANVAGAGFIEGTNGTANNCASGTPKYTPLPGVGSTSAPSLFAMYCIVAATGAYQAQATTSSIWQAVLATYKALLLVPPTIAKAFGAANLNTNATTTLTFTVNNPNGGSQLTGVGFTDPLPAGLVVATPNGLTGSCGGGTITATAGSSTISLAGATLAGGTSCNFSVNVTGTTAGTKNNTTSAVTSNEAGTGNVATASINIVAQLPPTIAKAFGAATLVQNATTTLTFTLTNPNAASALTGVGFTDPLPAGLVVATPNGLTGSCGGGTITATAGSTTISLAGAALAAGASCTFTVSVTATGGGTLTNNTSAVTSSAGPGNVATASISVTVPAVPTLSTLGQALVVLMLVLTALLFLRRRLPSHR